MVIPETARPHFTRYVLNRAQEALQKTKKGRRKGVHFLYLLATFALCNPPALLITQPLSIAYVKIAGDLAPSGQRHYKNVFSCLKEIYDKEGGKKVPDISDFFKLKAVIQD
jgi:hypothetical protein